MSWLSTKNPENVHVEHSISFPLLTELQFPAFP